MRQILCTLFALLVCTHAQRWLDLPKCARLCIDNMFQLADTLGCQPIDGSRCSWDFTGLSCTSDTRDCLCNNQNFKFGIRDCSAAICNTADAAHAVQEGESFCQRITLGLTPASSVPTSITPSTSTFTTLIPTPASSVPTSITPSDSIFTTLTSTALTPTPASLTSTGLTPMESSPTLTSVVVTSSTSTSSTTISTILTTSTTMISTYTSATTVAALLTVSATSTLAPPRRPCIWFAGGGVAGGVLSCPS